MYDEGGKCVHLGAQMVPKWGPEISDSRPAWHAEVLFSQFATHLNPKRPIAMSEDVYGPMGGSGLPANILDRVSGGLWRVGLLPLYY